MADVDEGASRQGPPDSTRDADDLARVAELVARAGLPLSAAEIAELVPQYRYDRDNFEHMRAMLAPEDESAHVIVPARVVRPTGSVPAVPRAPAFSGDAPGDAASAGDAPGDAASAEDAPGDATVELTWRDDPEAAR